VFDLDQEEQKFFFPLAGATIVLSVKALYVTNVPCLEGTLEP
jgi:hypothetical protein